METLELKSTITEIKNSLENLTSDRRCQNNQLTNQKNLTNLKNRRKKENKQSLRYLWDNIKWFNIRAIIVQEGE